MGGGRIDRSATADQADPRLSFLTMRERLRSLLTESDDLDPPPVGRWDLVLAASLAAVGLADIPEDLAVWQPATSVVAVVAAAVVVWRRSRPLAAVLVAFGAEFLLKAGAAAAGTQTEMPFGQLVALTVLAYALGRWARWRELMVGTVAMVAMAVSGEAASTVPEWGELVTSMLTWGLGAALGVTARYRAALVRARDDQVRNDERERIARELHDVVAHQVSAIAIQAQGARQAATSDATVAVDALARIHDTAARALTDMRQILTVLRDRDDDSDLPPQADLCDLPSLATPPGVTPVVEVAVTGEAGEVPAGAGTAVYRIAQEAVTNARRHAQGATRILVSVDATSAAITLTVADDGRSAGERSRSGYGLVGMRERAVLLGGTFTAGPQPERGWRIHAILPLEGSSS